jgi:FkbM family methyltransferase
MVRRVRTACASERGGSISLPMKVLAVLMRRMPTDIRRADVIWLELYRRIGGGGYSPDQALDRAWPSGLQQAVRGTHQMLMRLDLQNWSDRRAYFSGRYYQPDISRVLERLLRPGDQYIDIGANVGMTALLARSRIGPTGKGLAFEPNPIAFARLQEHFEINGVTNFELVPRAVADDQAARWLFMPRDETLLGTLVPEAEEGLRVEVQTTSAEPYLVDFDVSRPTLIKIDVEGYEVHVLRALRSLLAAPNCIIVSEVADAKLQRAGDSRNQLHTLLAGWGFVPFRINVRASRWRKALEFYQLDGPLELAEYDAVFAKPSSSVFRERVEPFLVANAAELVFTAPGGQLDIAGVAIKQAT